MWKSAHCHPATKPINVLLLDNTKSLFVLWELLFWLKRFLIDPMEQSCCCYCFERYFCHEFLYFTLKCDIDSNFYSINSESWLHRLPSVDKMEILFHIKGITKLTLCVWWLELWCMGCCCIPLSDFIACLRSDSQANKLTCAPHTVHPSRPALGPTQPPVQWVPGHSRG
jgi:hypothetical protein